MSSRFTYAATWLRGLLFVPLLTFHTAIWSVIAIFSGAVGFHRGGNIVVHYWSRGILWLYNVKIIKYGVENIPRVTIDPAALKDGERGVLFLFNHQSFFDIFTVHAAFTERVRFGAKIELFSIPVFGFAMRAIGVLPIAREKREKVMAVYRNAEAKFASGWSFVLAPEGTRQDEPSIGRFKKGPFIFAINAQVAIVPIVIKGSYDVFPKDTWLMNVGAWSRTIEIHYLPRIETKGLAISETDRLVESTRNTMVAAYEA